MRQRISCPDLLPDVIPVIGPDGNMRTLAEIEDAVIDYAMNVCGSRQNAAAALGIGRSTLYRKLRSFGRAD